MEEFRGIRRRDLNFDNQVAYIVEVVVTTENGTNLVKEPKSHYSRRTVSIPEKTTGILKNWKSIQDKKKDELGSAWKDDVSRVFTTQKGTSPNPSNLRRALKRILERAELPQIRFHDLRHTDVLEHGQHPKVVAERLGHSSITITMNRYSHALPNIQDEAANKLEESLLG